jgi:hypothetical protein
MKKVVVILGVVALVTSIGAAPANAQAVFEILNGKGCFGCQGADAAAPLEIRKSDGTAQVRVRDTGGAQAKTMFNLINDNGNQTIFRLNDGVNGAWDFKVAGAGFVANLVGVGGNEMAISKTGNMTISGTLTELSSREAKHRFADVDNQEILAKVLELPIKEWSYKDDRNSIRHVGPVAEDFHAAFGLNGNNTTGIAATDARGVTLAAIQGLNEKLEAKNDEIARLNAKLAELEAVVTDLAKK